MNTATPLLSCPPPDSHLIRQTAVPPALLTVANLNVERHGAKLLQQVSLALAGGERLAILGPNGAGKSTLLKCLSGEIGDYRGHMEFGRQPLQHLSSSQRAQRIAVMPQHTDMLFPFRVHEVVAIGRTPFADEQTSLEWQRQAMQLTECWHLRDRRYPGLSGGEQQRVQLARVLVQIWQALDQPQRNNPDRSHLLLLDECTSALDPAHQHSIMNAVNRFAAAGVGVIAVMHDIALAASWADKVLILKQGKVAYLGGREGLNDPRLLALAYDLPADLARRYANSNQLWCQ
ncbi:heme ABC transporter ATP-binding protein [Oceanobacter mangrovi]|uniref:heme ABC transporter ATP-binding protein n=1 Tax=Oceanobacter mangrovi TaxID=2862510 RepID=UPI001C8E7CD3|nr:heme ABC transporter ATP-binding protein [Oceanobacter mangrovi]